MKGKTVERFLSNKAGDRVVFHRVCSSCNNDKSWIITVTDENVVGVYDVCCHCQRRVLHWAERLDGSKNV